MPARFIDRGDGARDLRPAPSVRRAAMKKMFAILAMAGLMVAAGCNTVRGAGQDLESAANAVDNRM